MTKERVTLIIIKKEIGLFWSYDQRSKINLIRLIIQGKVAGKR